MISEKDEVTLPKLIDSCCNRLSLYNPKVVKEIIYVFLEELRNSIIKNYCVKLTGYFVFRHKQKNEKWVGNFGKEKKLVPAHMAVKVTFSKSGILKPLNQYYKRTKKPVPESLRDIPIKDFK